jgi:gamma-D-glutamyl-L-lysine dipeptidyl-peptidase
MKYAICNLSIVPLRSKPSDQSEMTSQLLFGDLMEVLGVHKGWAKVILTYDNYEGWVDVKQILPISDTSFNNFSTFTPHYTTDILGILTNANDNSSFPIMMGSSLPNVVNNTFYIEETKYVYESAITGNSKKATVEDVINCAYMYLHTPYLWGGRSPFGIDCSGFTQMVFRICGVKLARDAWQQAQQGQAIDFLTQSGAADLAFFENEEGKIVHTGILIGIDKIMHASGMVRIDTIDHEGIFNNSTNKYTHKLRLIKRLID